MQSCNVADIEKIEEGKGNPSLKDNIESVDFSISIIPIIETRDDDPFDPEKDFADYMPGDSEICKGKEINAIYYKAFELDDETGNIKQSDTNPSLAVVSDIKNTSIKIDLDRTKGYKILFWAQHNKKGSESFSSPYELSPAMDVKINYEEILNNDERIDAFYGSIYYEWKKGITEKEVTLHRPFAQVNVGSIIADWLPSGFYNKKTVKSQMTVSNVADHFSIEKGKVIPGSSRYDVTFNFHDIFFGPTQDLEYMEPEDVAKLSFKRSFLYVDFNENGKIDPSPTSSSGSESNDNVYPPGFDNNVEWWRYERSRYISMAYILVDNEEALNQASDVVDVRFNIGYSLDDEDAPESALILPYKEMIFDNVAVRPNFRTNIVGSLFSKQQRIFVNLSPVINELYSETDRKPSDSNRMVSKEIMDREGFMDLEAAFNRDNQDELESLFEKFGYEEDDTRYFVLGEDIERDDILQVRWDFVLYGNAHTVKLKIFNSGNVLKGSDYYNIGPVRNLYISDSKGKNTIFIDDDGFIFVLNSEGEWFNTWNQLYDLDGSQNFKSYNVNCTTGEIASSNYYPPKYN